MLNHVLIRTNKGDILIDLFEDTPETKSNFLMHTKMSYYNGTLFHRVTGFCIQGGSNNLPKYKPTYIKHEITYHRFGLYTVGMADAGIGTATTQFFITKCECPSFNGRYIAFGQVVKGGNIVRNIEKGDIIEEIYAR